MDENYKQMMRQNLKMSGMSDEQIEETLAMQEAAMQQYAKMDMSQWQQNAQEAIAGMQKEMSGMLDGGSYFELVENPSINASYQWAVACGADLAYLRIDVLNDLSTGTDGEICRCGLEQDWGIETREDFIEMAESLKTGRHWMIYRRLAEGENIPDFEQEKTNLEQALPVFRQDGLTQDVPNMLVWDLGRLINIARFAFDAGLIDRPTALSYIRDAALQVKRHYGSWKELSVGYQFGRAVWGGLGEYEELKEGMEQLLTEPDSPWVRLPFDMTLDFGD
jgi:hypothetical protein